MVQFPSVVVDIIDIRRVMIRKTKDHPPVGANGDRPKAFQPTFKGVQVETGHIHVAHKTSRVEPCQNIAQLVGVFRIDAALVVRFVATFQTFVPDRSNHCRP